MTHVLFHFRRTLTLFATVVLASQSTAAMAGAFVMFSEEKKLVDQQVLAAGEISLMQRPGSQSGAEFPLALRPMLYQLGRYCFISSENLGSKAGLLLLNASSTFSVAIIASEVSGLKVQVTEATNVDCNAVRQQNAQQTLSETEAQRKQIEQMSESIKKLQKPAK